jgi:hypothetical protein
VLQADAPVEDLPVAAVAGACLVRVRVRVRVRDRVRVRVRARARVKVRVRVRRVPRGQSTAARAPAVQGPCTPG